ncbi:MAG: hypothetical protein ACXACX_20530 [Candidatus Hodarchaeales archaeon]|jgi:uncharacterized protein YdeI (BOF family)
MPLQSAKQRIIKDLKEEDERVQITGYVRELVEEEQFVLDDDTGKIRVDIKNIDFTSKENDLINVIGNLIEEGNDIKLFKAEIIQDKNQLNFEYYKKLYELKKKYG